MVLGAGWPPLSQSRTWRWVDRRVPRAEKNWSLLAGRIPRPVISGSVTKRRGSDCENNDGDTATYCCCVQQESQRHRPATSSPSKDGFSVKKLNSSQQTHTRLFVAARESEADATIMCGRSSRSRSRRACTCWESQPTCATWRGHPRGTWILPCLPSKRKFVLTGADRIVNATSPAVVAASLSCRDKQRQMASKFLNLR